MIARERAAEAAERAPEGADRAAIIEKSQKDFVHHATQELQLEKYNDPEIARIAEKGSNNEELTEEEKER